MLLKRLFLSGKNITFDHILFDITIFDITIFDITIFDITIFDIILFKISKLDNLINENYILALTV